MWVKQTMPCKNHPPVTIFAGGSRKNHSEWRLSVLGFEASGPEQHRHWRECGHLAKGKKIEGPKTGMIRLIYGDFHSEPSRE